MSNLHFSCPANILRERFCRKVNKFFISMGFEQGNNLNSAETFGQECQKFTHRVFRNNWTKNIFFKQLKFFFEIFHTLSKKTRSLAKFFRPSCRNFIFRVQETLWGKMYFSKELHFFISFGFSAGKKLTLAKLYQTDCQKCISRDNEPLRGKSICWKIDNFVYFFGF